MSWAIFNTTLWPNVLVKLGPYLDDKGFEEFKRDWLELYDHKEDFTLVFDTSSVGWVNPKYAFRMSEFIKLLREKEMLLGKQYLEKSIIFYDSIYIKLLLNIIFTLQSPVAPVHILPQKDFNIDKYLLKRGE